MGLMRLCRSPTLMVTMRQFCSKETETQVSEALKAKASTETITNTIVPNRLHRILLVVGRNYASFAEVPGRVSAQSINKAMDRFRVFTLTLGVLGFCLLYAGTAVQSSREHWEGRSQQLLIQQEVESTKFEPVRPEIWRKKAT